MKRLLIINEVYGHTSTGKICGEIRDLPKNILGLEKTRTQVELAAFYTVADVLVNPSLEETFGMAQVEAYAWGHAKYCS